MLWADNFEAISGRASSDYVRKQNPDGTYHTETYAFGKGGYWSGPVSDASIDQMDFMAIARIVAQPLASQHYLPAKDPKTTNLLIMVYWGTTYAPEHASESREYENLEAATEELHNASSNPHPIDPPQAIDQLADAESAALTEVQRANSRREHQDFRNAMMLGYDSWWSATFGAHSGTPMEHERRDMLNELEEDRYFVVLMAYDFQLLQQQKKHRLVWETRFSVREHVNRFDQALPAMALGASKYFGQNSPGLIHDKVPEGSVEIGPLKDLGEPAEPLTKK